MHFYNADNARDWPLFILHLCALFSDSLLPVNEEVRPPRRLSTKTSESADEEDLGAYSPEFGSEDRHALEQFLSGMLFLVSL